MAEVFLGTASGASGFQKPVAIKRIHPRLANHDASVGMLAEEAKLAVSIAHKNIVQTFDLQRFGDDYVLVMEHVDGYDMQHVLDALRRTGRRLPLDLAVHVIAEVCRGLEHAHEHRDEAGKPAELVHRDVSPQNILLSFAGEVKIADFGIAKTRERASDPESRVIKGKYFYMSPEQARGEPVDRRSDIFSAGVVLWELVVGERLHHAPDVASLLELVRRAAVPLPSSLQATIPAALDEIVARATEEDPADRFFDAGEMADALTTFLATRPTAIPSRGISELLKSVPRQAARSESEPRIPQTRDAVPTLSIEQQGTPPEPPLRFDMDHGEPTLAGWQSPVAQRTPRLWLSLLVLGSAAAVLVSWLLHGA
jgi:serine/threonine protein kinase